MRRRVFLWSSAALAACAARPTSAPAPVSRARRFAVTMDDPSLVETPRLDVAARDAAILATLAARRHLAALFVCGKRVDSEEGAKLLHRWSAAGHALGNHSYAHRYFHDPAMTVVEFAAELKKGEAVIRPHRTFTRRFRFPFLKEGDTKEKRDLAREVLVAQGYTNGHVTIDASDWAFDARLTKRLRREPAADLAPFRAAYVAHMVDRARHYDGLARDLFGRTIAHTLLVHHSLLNALFLGDVLQALTNEGFTLVNADEAYADPIYRSLPDTLPAGESLVASIARSKGAVLRYPGEDADYEKSTLDALEPPASGG
ncbi:MAG: polysaccharide deacetylase family protein [Myxococcales bacterium]|nr:polysaccharide deacetylase family protein [Myxococcales bacterium]